jgi:uncharacterized protein (DUF362 family)
MDVYLQHTQLRTYSHALTADSLPEGVALKQLREHMRLNTGIDLFSDNIKPGDRVVIKPNLVRDYHPDGLDLYSLITHPAVIRAVIDEVYQALQGEGEIVIADAPIGDADFDKLLKITGIEQIVDYYWRTKRFPIAIRDLRKYRYTMKQGSHGYTHEARHELAGDPLGYIEVDLGSSSAFSDIGSPHLLQGTDVARRAETMTHHSLNSNKYLIACTVLDADVLISMPKLKTHSKVGITLNAKNMVGINGDKNYLPHFRWGSQAEGGDQYPSGVARPSDVWRMRLGRMVGDHLLSKETAWSEMAVWAVQQASGLGAKVLRLPPVTPINGNWSGNDTCWRLPVDLIQVAIFADRFGHMQVTPQRRFISIIDGIIGGEGDGPLCPTPKPCGVLIAGLNPVAVDLVGARIMGFDPDRIRHLQVLSQGLNQLPTNKLVACRPSDINVHSNHEPWRQLFQNDSESWLEFQPPARWEGNITLDKIPSTYTAA